MKVAAPVTHLGSSGPKLYIRPFAEREVAIKGTISPSKMHPKMIMPNLVRFRLLFLRLIKMRIISGLKIIRIGMISPNNKPMLIIYIFNAVPHCLKCSFKNLNVYNNRKEDSKIKRSMHTSHINACLNFICLIHMLFNFCQDNIGIFFFICNCHN